MFVIRKFSAVTGFLGTNSAFNFCIFYLEETRAMNNEYRQEDKITF